MIRAFSRAVSFLGITVLNLVHGGFKKDERRQGVRVRNGPNGPISLRVN